MTWSWVQRGPKAKLLRWLWHKEWISYGWTGTLWCFLAGEHTPERDMCNNPDHDFCAFCGKSMPGMWPGFAVSPGPMKRQKS